MHIVSKETQQPHHLYNEHSILHSLKFIAAYVLTTMAYPHRTVPMYDITTDLANHANKIGLRWR